MPRPCSPFSPPQAISWPLGRVEGVQGRGGQAASGGVEGGAAPGGALPGGACRRRDAGAVVPFVAAKWASLTELCANTPQPHQVAAPGVPSIRERAQP